MLMNVSGTSWPGISTENGSTKSATIEKSPTLMIRWTHVTSSGGTAQRRNGAPIASVPLKCPATRPAMLVMRMASSGRKKDLAVIAEKEKDTVPSSSKLEKRAAKISCRRKSTRVIASVETAMRTQVATRFGAGDLRSLSFVIHHSRPMTMIVITSGAPDMKMLSLASKVSGALMSMRRTADPNRDRARRMNGAA
jgi:hypothetical protein